MKGHRTVLILCLAACTSESGDRAQPETGLPDPPSEDSHVQESEAIEVAYPSTGGTPFNGTDLTGWQGDSELWSVEGGAIVGHSDTPVAQNEFLFLNEPVKDFYFTVEVKLTPDERNSGIQFRSQRHEEGYAIGYQADIGRNVWGRLYHERGRGKLDWTDEGEKHIRPGEWNRIEILAVDSRIWTAVNGHLSVSLNDPTGEREGQIAFQLHAGPPSDVRFRNMELVHDPEVTLAGLNEAALNAALRDA